MVIVTKARYTPEDLLRISDRPMPELVDGRLVEREMGQESDAIALRIGRLIGNFVEAHDLGLVNGAQGSYQVFPDDSKKVRIPDVSFTRKERLPGGPAKGHARVAPDLAVEVISPRDRANVVWSRIEDFLNAGTSLIWTLDPGTRTVLIVRGDRSAAWLRAGDTLDGEGVLPGFSRPVADLFL